MRTKIDTNDHEGFLRRLVDNCTSEEVAGDVRGYIMSLVQAVIAEEGHSADILINNVLEPGLFRTRMTTFVGYLWTVKISSKNGQKYDGHCYLEANNEDHFLKLHLEDDAIKWLPEPSITTTTLQ